MFRYYSFEQHLLPALALNSETQQSLLEALTTRVKRNSDPDNPTKLDDEQGLLTARFFEQATAFVQLTSDFRNSPPYSSPEFQELARILERWLLALIVVFWTKSSIPQYERLLQDTIFLENDIRLKKFINSTASR